MPFLSRATLVTTALTLVLAAPAAAQVSNEQQAEVLINTARKAYNEKNYPIATAKFREYLQRFPNFKDAAGARHGLALVLLEGPQKNFAEARDLLQAIAGNKDLPEHASVVYHLGAAYRGLGVQELDIALAKPQEAPQRKQAALKLFEEAGKQFFAARLAYTLRAAKVPLDEKELPPVLEWAIRARCDEAEMLLRQGKGKEAQALTAPFVKDPVLTRSRLRDFGRYLHGFGSYLAKDYQAAETTLTQLTPFLHPVYGPHARYLLARTHHAADERAEAAVHYEGVLSDYARNKKVAALALQKPEVQKDPAAKAQWEALLKNPPPDHVSRAAYYWGVLLYEGGKFGEARGRFADFAKQYPTSTLLHEAQLRLGFCQVQLRDYNEAIKTLTPLVATEPRLADQTLFWLAKARVGAAPDPNNYPAYEAAVKGALDVFRQAADKAQQLTATDPEAKERRADILLEMADTQQTVKQYKEAAAIYAQLLADKLTPQREQELLQRQVTALHLAGDYDGSEKAVARFQEKYGKSILLPPVLFRHAENSYFRTLAAEKNPNLPDRGKTLNALYDETAKRYSVVIEKYPEFAKVNHARYGLALTFYRKGDLEKARATFETIPQPDRGGKLATVPYLMADCLLRLAPTGVPDDALAVGKLEDQFKSAAELLDAFAGGNPNHPNAADAQLKLGYCFQRLAALQGQPPERVKLLNAAKAVYDKLLAKRQPGNAVQDQALLERAKCYALLGNVGQADNDLRNFTRDPLTRAPIAPLAHVQLATLLRGQNKVKEAVDLLAKARQTYEAELTKDPQRAGWVAVLRYHHGVALREAKQYPEARAAFDSIVKQFAGRPEAPEAALRLGQCLKEEGLAKIEQSDKLRGSPKKEDVAKAAKLREEGVKEMRDAVAYLEAQAEQLKAKQPPADARARMLYEIAWAYRDLAEPEVAAARAAMVEAELKRDPKAAPPAPADIPLAKVPVQPAEKKAHAAYLALINDFGDAPLATDARFELAELFGQRHDYDAAIKLLNDGLDKEPPQDLTEKLRLRLGVCQAAKGNHKAALAQFNAVASNGKSPLAAQATYRAGEALIALKEWPEAAKRLSVFRDAPPFQNVPGVTDRALLRLGHTYNQVQDWDKSRQAYDVLAQRFPNSPWVHEARYGSGWALRQQKQYDQAVALFARVKADTLTETGAKAQLQIGLCRMDQKRYAEAANELMVVPLTYDYRELTPVALLEAARAFGELGQNDNAVRLLRRVVRDFPRTPWADTASERLEKIKGN
jgi:TolA-binding protein